MSGGAIKILWDREDSAEVTIYGGGGQTSTAFTVVGTPVTFPYTLEEDTTFTTTVGDSYSISVLYNEIEIADHPDGRKAVNLFGGNSELVFAPSPDDGFVFPGSAGGGVVLGAWFSLSTGTLVPDGTGQDVTFSVTTNDDLPPSDLVTVTGGDGGTVAVVQSDGLYQFTVDGFAIAVEAGATPIAAAFATLNIDLNGDGAPVPLALVGPAPCGLYPPGPNWRSTPMGVSAPVTFRADDEISLTAAAEAFDSSDDPAIDGTFSVGGRLGFVRLGDIPA